MKHFYVCLLMLGSLVTQAQTISARITLEEATQAAEERNPELRAAARRLSAAQAQAATKGFLDDPMAMYKNWGSPLSEPWNWNKAQHMFQVQRTFTNGDRRRAERAASEEDAKAVAAEVEIMRQQIAVEVKKAFNTLLRTSDELRLYDRQAELLRESLGAAMARYTVGKTPQADVLRAQMLLTRLEEERLELEKERELARAELNTLLHRNVDAATEPVGLYRAPESIPSLLDLEHLALDNRPELATLKSQRQAAEARVRQARLAYKPDYTLSAGYMVMPKSMDFRNAYMLEAQMTLPWWNRSKHDADIHAATAEGLVTDAEIDARQSAIFLEIEQALTRLKTAQRSLRLYEDTLTPQAEASLKASLAAYTNDRAEFLNLVDSQNLLLDIETKRLKAAAEVDVQMAELERAVGTTLETKTQAPAKAAEEMSK